METVESHFYQATPMLQEKIIKRLNSSLKAVLVSWFLFTTCMGYAQRVVIRGTVTDSISGEGLPYASLIFQGTSIGTATDGEGRFELPLPERTQTLEVSYLGYNPRRLSIRPGQSSPLHIRLAPDGIALEEVIIKPGKERYRKKDNPAVRLVKQVIERRKDHDPRNKAFYQYDQYERMLLGLNDYQQKPKKNGKVGKFHFLNEYIDTLETGTTILPVLEKEKIETVFYRKEPKSERRIVQGQASSGVDEMLSQDGVE